MATEQELSTLRSDGKAIALAEKQAALIQKDIGEINARMKSDLMRASERDKSSEYMAGLRARYEARIAAKQALLRSAMENVDRVTGRLQDSGVDVAAARDAAPKHRFSERAMSDLPPLNPVGRPGAGPTGVVVGKSVTYNRDGSESVSERTVRTASGELVRSDGSTRPGVYGPGRNPVIVQDGRGSTAAKVEALRKNNQSYNDPLYQARENIVRAREERRLANRPIGQRTDGSYIYQADVQDRKGRASQINYINAAKNTRQNGTGNTGEYNRNTNSRGPSRLENFEVAISKQAERDQKFFQGEGFKRIRDTANLLTGGTNLNPFSQSFGISKRYQDRSFFGKFSEDLTNIGLNAGVGLGGSIGSALDKSYLTVRAATIRETRKEVIPGLVENFGPTATQLKTQFNPLTPEGLAGVASVGVLATLGGPAARNNPVNRAVLPRLYPNKFTTAEATGIKFVEAVTVPTKVAQLRGLEGKSNVPTIHVTTAKTPDSFVTQSQPGAGGFRQQYQLFNFYKSSPEVGGGVLTPRAYLGYAGIESVGTAASSGRLIIGSPTVRLLLFKDTITPTPRSAGKTIMEINRYQIKKSGTTQVPSENILQASVEGQLMSPSRYVETTPSKLFGLIKATEKPIKGYENSPGSVISRTGPSQFFYYKQVLPKFFGVIPRSRYFKFEVVPSKTSPVTGDTVLPAATKSIDVVSYAKEFSSPGRQVSSPRPVSAVSSVVATASESVPLLLSSSSRPSRSASRASSSVSAAVSESHISTILRTSSSRSSSRPSRSSVPRYSSGSFYSSVQRSVASSSGPLVSFSSSPSMSRGRSSSPVRPVSPSETFIPPFELSRRRKPKQEKPKRKSRLDELYAYTPTLAGTGIASAAPPASFRTGLAVRPVIRAERKERGKKNKKRNSLFDLF